MDIQHIHEVSLQLLQRSSETVPEVLRIHATVVGLDDLGAFGDLPTGGVLRRNDHLVSIATSLHPLADDDLRLLLLIVASSVDEVATTMTSSDSGMRRRRGRLTAGRNSRAARMMPFHPQHPSFRPMRCLRYVNSLNPDRWNVIPRLIAPKHSGLTFTPALGASCLCHPSKLEGFAMGLKDMI